jgi:hypothetical protein
MCILEIESAITLSSPRICVAIIEDPRLPTMFYNFVSIVRRSGFVDQFLFIIYCTPVLSVNDLIHYRCRKGYKDSTASNTAWNSCFVDPCVYKVLSNVPLAK